MTQKRWTYCYDRDADSIKNAMMTHCYYQKFGHQAILMAEDFSDSYNPLCLQ